MNEHKLSPSGVPSGYKALALAPAAVIVLSLLIALIIYPVANLQPKELPVALLSEDAGVQLPSGAVNIGQMAAAAMPAAMEEAAGENPPPVKWIAASGREEALNMLADGEVYAAVIFPAGFSAGLMSVMSPAPAPPVLEIRVNQGANPAVASALTAMFTQIEANLGAQMRPLLANALQTGAGGAGISFPGAAALEMYRQPFVTELSFINELAADMAGGQSHLFAFVILWICCLVASAILFRCLPASGADDRLKFLRERAGLVAGEALVALTIALMIVFNMTAVFDVDIPVGATLGFAAAASFCTLLLIHGVLAWTGLGGISLFVLIMALGLIASNLPYELLPVFWQDWIYPWIPLRFISEGLRSVFYMGEGAFNDATGVLMWIGAGGLALLLLSIFKPRRIKAESGK
ncbi:MAG: hypothetical protein LBH21_00745 [Gracilibacteraceae bacterium]|jgi:uncharacterized phage infection (PIP) family protein YhgE|nr:hypothetical protein [Gracilibacteraceae bacterium]